MAVREVLDTTNNLITLTELKSYLDSTSTGDDTRYKRLVNSVSGRFNGYTNRKLKLRSITEYRDGNGTNAMYAREYPIVSTSTSIDIRIDTDRLYSTADKVSSTDIVIYSTVGKIVLDDDTFTAGEQSVKMVYSAGYSVSSSGSTVGTTGTMPNDLRYAAMEMCRFNLNRERDSRIGVRNMAAEGASVTYETDMPWSVKQTLDMYRRQIVE